MLSGARRTVLSRFLTARLHRQTSSLASMQVVQAPSSDINTRYYEPVNSNIASTVRDFSAASAAAAPKRVEPVEAAAAEPSDIVHSAIKRIMDDYSSMSSDQEATGTSQASASSLPNLQESLELVRHQLEEAGRCLEDVREIADSRCDADTYAEEVTAAEMALEKAVWMLTDWIDDVRSQNETEWTMALRDSLAHRIKALRQELRDLKQQQPPPPKQPQAS